MKLRIFLFLLATGLFAIFTVFSYTVAKESWQTIDFDVTVKLQDHISRRFDQNFSYFSLLGSAEVTFAIAGFISIFNLIRFKMWSSLGWLMIIPASFVEIFGKLVLFHPGTPVLFHRSVIETALPSFYIHTNFSYPSGHMTRTTFLATVLLIIGLSSQKSMIIKIIYLGLAFGFIFMMGLTRVYLGEHWLSDVIGGVILGASSGILASIFIIGKKADLVLTDKNLHS